MLLLGGLLMLAVLLMLALLHLINVLQRKPSKAGPLTGRPGKSFKEFADQADEIRVSVRVARETYNLLLEHYPTPMCIDLLDDLRRDLNLSDLEILRLYRDLLGKTDRLLPTTFDSSMFRTINDLLLEVETNERNEIDRSALRLRASDCPYPVRPAVEVIEFKQTSKIIDPDYQRRQHFRWLSRRISDYRGLLSRASDAFPKRAHQGPFRRSDERASNLSTVSYKRNASVSLTEEQIHKTSSQKSAEPKAAPALKPSPDHPVSAIRLSGPEYPSL